VLLVVDMIREFVDHRWPTGHSETGYVLRGGGWSCPNSLA